MRECNWCRYCSVTSHCNISGCQWTGGFERCPWPEKRNKIAVRNNKEGTSSVSTNNAIDAIAMVSEIRKCNTYDDLVTWYHANLERINEVVKYD